MPRKTSPNSQQTNTVNIAITASVITVIGVIATAYFNYLSTRAQIEVPINATQTAEAKIITLASPTSSILVSPTETSAIVASLFTQPPTIIFGPVDGELIHNPNDNIIPVEIAKVYLADFILDVEFFNPYDSKEGQWSYGMSFRETNGNENYTFEIFWDSSWVFFLSEPSGDGNLYDQDISGGYIKNLDISPNGSNRLRLIVQGDRASFIVNDILVSNLDVSAKKRAGGVWIGTGYIDGQEIQGKSTKYKNFTIWSLP